MEVGAVLKVAAEVAGAVGLLEVSHRAYNWLERRASFNQDIETAKDMLGLTHEADVAYRHDSVHALFSESTELHPDNLAGLTAAAGNDFARAKDLRRIRKSLDIRAALSTNLVLIGSPTAEGLSRPAFGYEPDVDEDSLTLNQPPIDLPFKWVISKTLIDERAIARRYVAGKGLVARPNWRIETNKQIYMPEVDSSGYLSIDYLLVTRLRNYLSNEALDEGRYIVSFGGAHGTATRAIEILLRDRETLRRIGERIKGRPAAYQLLLRVGKMKHDMMTGTRATRIELVGDPIVLPDTRQIWRTASEIARINLERWLSSKKQKKKEIRNE